MDIAAKQRLRTMFMSWAYNVADGSTRNGVSPAEFRADATWNDPMPSEDDITDVVKYLEAEGLVTAHYSLEGTPSSIQLRHAGIREVEEARQAPDKATEHFVPMVNITAFHGNAYGIQMQQGSPGASQTGTFNTQLQEYAEAFIAEARRLSQEVDPDTRLRTEADLVVMEHDLASPQPRTTVLQAIGNSVRDYLTAAVGAAAAAGLNQIPWP